MLTNRKLALWLSVHMLKTGHVSFFHPLWACRRALAFSDNGSACLCTSYPTSASDLTNALVEKMVQTFNKRTQKPVENLPT